MVHPSIAVDLSIDSYVDYVINPIEGEVARFFAVRDFKRRIVLTHARRYISGTKFKLELEHEKILPPLGFEPSTLSMPRVPMRYDALDRLATTARLLILFFVLINNCVC